MSKITIRFRKNPKNPIRNSTNADTTYPHLGMRRGNPSSYAFTTVSLKCSGKDVIVTHTHKCTSLTSRVKVTFYFTLHTHRFFWLGNIPVKRKEKLLEPTQSIKDVTEINKKTPF